MQAPSRKSFNLCEVLSLTDCSQHRTDLLDLFWRQSARVIVPPESFQRFMTEADDTHGKVYGITVRLSKPDRAYIPSGPRPMAAMPVRETSTRPSGSISATNCSILSLLPVISNTKLSVVASITRARKASASRNASTRCSPLLFTL